jgi:polysaccharide export outer membrane protein
MTGRAAFRAPVTKVFLLLFLQKKKRLSLLAFVLAACTPPPPLPPAPRAAPAAPYRVQVGDQLAIRLFYTPELNEDVTVRPDGRITTTLAQDVPAAGRTPAQVAESLRGAYDAELIDPRLTVGVKSYAPVRVYVAGEVLAPGEITSAGPAPTLLQAIARAGGLRVTGDTHAVLIVRRGAQGRPVVYAAQYADVVSGRDPGADVPLQPYDVVVVPRTGVADAYVWVNQHVQQFVPVSWGFSYNVNPLVK